MPASVAHGHRQSLSCLVALSAIVAIAVFVLTASRSEASKVDITPSTTTSTPVAIIERTPVAAIEPTPAVTAMTATTTTVAIIEPTPTPTPTPTVAAPANVSNCRGDLPGSVMTVAMADISYVCSVYSGGQAVIDSGAATLVTDQGSSPLLATHPGDPGTLWIAAHRSTHGAPFAAVPSLADGAVVTVSDGTVTAAYRVVGRAHLEVRGGLVVDSAGEATDAATQDSVLRPDRGGALAPRLLLQTCDGKNWRWMIYADLISG